MLESANPAEENKKVLRVGLAGVGTVGAAVYHILDRHAAELTQKCGVEINITAISARSQQKAQQNGINLQNLKWYNDPRDLAISDDIDVFVELIGGENGIAYEAVSAALKIGRPVVTANKALLAGHGTEIAVEAEKHATPLYYEAAIAGGIPIVKVLKDALIGNNITRIYGILNGTCNYILTQMEEEKLSFDDCLKEAQLLGYAEADPSFDIDGQDTAHKLTLLTSLAFNTVPNKEIPHLEGIRSITQQDIQAAQDLGYRIKLLGIASKTSSGIEQSVQPIMFPVTSAIAQISDVTNAVMVESSELGELLLSGPGAGGDATASAVVADISDIAKNNFSNEHSAVFGLPMAKSQHLPAVDEQIRQGGYFIRLNVYDRAGVFASVAEIMAQHFISLKSIVQKEPIQQSGKRNKKNTETKTIVLITHATTDSAIAKAFTVLRKADYLLGEPQKICIEEKI